MCLFTPCLRLEGNDGNPVRFRIGTLIIIYMKLILKDNWANQEQVTYKDSNGWYQLNTDLDLPKNTCCRYYVYNYAKLIMDNISLDQLLRLWKSREITHFKPMYTLPPII